MKLKEKGTILPPPLLHQYPQMVSAEIQKWKNIIAATHWHLYDTTQVDGADFYVGEEELAHIHLNGEVHLATNKELKKVILDNKLAQKFPYSEDWVQFQISSKEDVKKAIRLFQLNYDRINGMCLDDLIVKIKKFTAITILHE